MADRRIRCVSVDKRLARRGIGFPVTRAILFAAALLLCGTGGIVEWRGKAAELDCKSIWNQPDPGTRDAAGMYLGVNYYGALALEQGEMLDDLSKLKGKGFRLVRVWPIILPGNDPGKSLVQIKWDDALKQYKVFLNSDKVGQFEALLLNWPGKGYQLDLSFDIQEFQRLSYFANYTIKPPNKSCPPYSVYEAAVMAVANYVKTKHPNWVSRVMIDVANEAVNAGGGPSDSGVGGTAFCRLTLDGTYSGKSWSWLLKDLITKVRGLGFESFFSMVGIGSKSDVISAAICYNKVYGQNFTNAPRAYIAPHFSREPCPSGWALKTSDRISCLYSSAVTGVDIKTYPLYMQEENRRRYTCCDASSSGLGAAGDCSPKKGDFCESWLKTCDVTTETKATDFFESLT